MCAWLLWGCFAEPGGGDGATGAVQTSSTTAVGSSSGGGSDTSTTTPPTSTGVTSETDSTTTSGSSATSIGTTPDTESTSGTLGDTTAEESSSGEPPPECDIGFSDLLSLSLDEAEAVVFTELGDFTNVRILVGQVSSGASESFMDAVATPEPDGSTTWVFSVDLGKGFVAGDAVVTFQGDDMGVPFEANCNVTLE